MRKQTALHLDPVVDVIDNSKMSDFKRCMRYGFFKHILGWKSPYPSIDLVFGASYHEGHEVLGIKGYKKENLDEAMNAFLTLYREEFSPSTDNDMQLAKGKSPQSAERAYRYYIEKYKNDAYEHLYCEIGIPVPIGDDRTFHIKIDKISRRRTDGKIIAIDHKTSSRETQYWAEQWESKNQFFGYIHGLLCLSDFDEVIGLLVDGTFLYKSSPPKFRRHLIRKSPMQMQSWLHNIQYWYDQIKMHIRVALKENSNQSVMVSFPQNDEGCVSYGKICPFFAICWSTPNPLRYYRTPDDTPVEFIYDHWDPRTDPVSNRINPETGEIIKVDKRKLRKRKKVLEPIVEDTELKTGLLFSIMKERKK